MQLGVVHHTISIHSCVRSFKLGAVDKKYIILSNIVLIEVKPHIVSEDSLPLILSPDMPGHKQFCVVNNENSISIDYDIAILHKTLINEQSVLSRSDIDVRLSDYPGA